MRGSRTHQAIDRRTMATVLVLTVVASLAAVIRLAAPAAAAVPAGFTELTAFSGLVEPTVIRFAPDGRIFVAEKRGTIQMYDGLADTTPTRVADLRTEVHNYWDRGLLGLEIDPQFPTRPYLYAFYTFDGPIGGTAPRWGTAGADSDPCPDPPGPTTEGCVVSSKLVRLTLTGPTTTKQDLIHDWCQQYPSHSAGDLVFGRDGALYASAGEGANFNFVDYGQRGVPVNPCGDPRGAGGAMTPPGAQGGALRAQDLRTSGDPVSLDGTVIRVNPDTGAALPSNPNAASADANARRIVAYGLRNPFRMVQRPGSDELWIGDVGWNDYEEINRLTSPTGPVRNFGWPCFEGPVRHPAYEAAGLSICQNLYAQGGDTKPFFTYRHGQPVTTNDNCATAAGSSVSGVSFQFYSGGPYPADYDGALFFADYSRKCIWVMTRGTDGLPSGARVRPFVTQAANPVNLELSPAGELFYADLNGGTIRRIVYQGSPATCTPGQFRGEYFANRTLTGSPVATSCGAPPLVNDWGTGAPAGVPPDNFSVRWTGSFSFSVAGTYTFTAVADDGIRVWVDGVPVIDEWRIQGARTFTAAVPLAAGPHSVRVEYFDATSLAVARLHWTAPAPSDPGAPAPVISSPTAGTRWAVGDLITFTGAATDPQDGTLAPERLRWEMVLQHCPAECHAHSLQQWAGSGGSIAAPDHEYPSYLELRLTATDSSGNATTVTRRLDPRTVPISLASLPTGLQLGLGGRTATSPFSGTFIVGGSTTVSAPSTQLLSGRTYVFTGWSDGGARSHDVEAGTTAGTYTASYWLTTCPQGQYLSSFFPNTTLSGSPPYNRCEAGPLDRNWGTGGPGLVGVDNFTGRWTGSFPFSAGSRRFTATSDDGIRVWLDGVLIIDRWGSKGTSTATRTVTAGVHTVRVDYIERTGLASARVTW
jgi:glucose/arabinose dehydrogenase